MRVRFLRPAEAEIDEAVTYFDEQRPGLGDRFEQGCINICLDVIAGDRKETAEPVEARPPVAMSPYHVVIHCSLCEIPTPLEHMVAVHSRGALCPGCIGAIEAAVAAARKERE
ncbi:MAG TPA: hypothetical protein VJ276_13710 [Thermoanaerobaculia bacterium]|nr:hypothetical protein [Thermoanaerobaculia bacterium]